MVVTPAEVVAQAALVSADARAALNAAGAPVIYRAPKGERCTKCRRKMILGSEDKNVCHCST